MSIDSRYTLDVEAQIGTSKVGTVQDIQTKIRGLVQHSSDKQPFQERSKLRIPKFHVSSCFKVFNVLLILFPKRCYAN